MTGSRYLGYVIDDIAVGGGGGSHDLVRVTISTDAVFMKLMLVVVGVITAHASVNNRLLLVSG